jgi:signal transduction histidine kinase
LDFPNDLPRVTLTAELRRNVFLTLKEALHNVAKHAHAKHVRVQLRADNGELLLVIADDGKGFATAQTNGTRNGLTNMRSRVEELGGTFTLRSAAAQGTTVEVRVPLHKSEFLNPKS